LLLTFPQSLTQSLTRALRRYAWWQYCLLLIDTMIDGVSYFRCLMAT